MFRRKVSNWHAPIMPVSYSAFMDFICHFRTTPSTSFAVCVFHHVPSEPRSWPMVGVCAPNGIFAVFEHNRGIIDAAHRQQCLFDKDAVLLKLTKRIR